MAFMAVCGEDADGTEKAMISYAVENDAAIV